MADVLEANSATANDVQQQGDAKPNLDQEQLTEKVESGAGADAVTTKVETNGDAHAQDVKEEIKDVKDEKNDDVKDEKNGDLKDDENDDASGSPDRKRKDAPVSITAHERHPKRGRGGHRYNNRAATRYEEQPESDDPDEIRRQVQFYFSDSNLPIDAYLLDATGGHKNRPVPLKVICNFKRMRHFQPFSIVRDAVKASNFLDLNDDDEITRKVALSEEFTDDPQKNRLLLNRGSMSRSIYAKGFGEETKSTGLEIESFFEPYGPINSVRLRRSDDGGFKGSVFVEFYDDEGQQRFMDLDPKPQWNGKDLQIMTKQEYVDMKHDGIMDGVVKPRSPTRQNRYGGDRKFRGNDRRGGYDDRRERRGSGDYVDKDNWKARRDQDQRYDKRDHRDNRGGGGNRGRGRGGNRGNRGGRGGSSFNDGRKRRRDDDDEERDDADEVDKSNVPSRAEAEAKRVQVETDAIEKPADGEAAGGAEKETKTEDGVASEVKKVDEPAPQSKKRALEDEGDEEREAKKVKEVS